MALISSSFYKKIDLTRFLFPFPMGPARTRRLNFKDFIFTVCFAAGEV
jgi:hypothetical protein